MGHIFVSYSRHDLEVVDCIVGKIENTGMRVWIDRDDIKAGKTWRAQIVEAIDTCHAFVLMLSSNSAASDNVRKEIDLAQDSGRTVFVIKLDGVAKLPAEMRYQLVGLQYIDLQTFGMEDAVNQLLNTLQEHFATSKPDKEQPVRQAEIVIQGVDPSAFDTQKQEQLVDFVSELTATPESQLQIAKLTTGSVHVFVDMPSQAAFELKARALNRDRRFKQLGIKSLRLIGDRKYIYISLGILTTTATLGALKILWMSIPPLFPTIFGVTAGKAIVIASAIVVTTAVGIAIPSTVGPILNPSQNSIPPHTPAPTKTFTKEPTRISKPNQTSTPSFTPTPQMPLVIRDTLCGLGPSQAYAVVSAVKSGMRVELLGRGNIEGWWVIQNPIYHIPCWLQANVLQIDPGYDLSQLKIFYPPPPPTPTPKPRIHTPHPPTPTPIPTCYHC